MSVLSGRQDDLFERARKVWRFISIYGPGRTFFKVAARLRLPGLSWSLGRGEADIGIIGCGQFAYATIGYFLQQRNGRRVAACYDIDPGASASFAAGLGVKHRCDDLASLLVTPGLRTVFIASNHASHAGYAVAALSAGHHVYVEKPVAVDLDQLANLERARRTARGQLYAGYNRPFSAAIADLHARLALNPNSGISMQCFVAGHVLGADHWYRRPEEGTRICGNVGHWLDLFVHVLSWRGLPDAMEISLTWADDTERDENLAISIATDRHDLCTIMLTARAEPFEGINESIQLQHGEALCKIDDFRSMSFWQGSKFERRRYWPKDPGHRAAIAQPFSPAPARSWSEVVDSTLIMLHITQMVRSSEKRSTFRLSEARSELERAIECL